MIDVYRETAGVEMQVSYYPWQGSRSSKKEESTAMVTAFVAINGETVRYQGMWIDVEYTGFITVSFTNMHPDDYDRLDPAHVMGDSDPGYVTLIVSRVQFVERGPYARPPQDKEWNQALRMQELMRHPHTHPTADIIGALAFQHT